MTSSLLVFSEYTVQYVHCTGLVTFIIYIILILSELNNQVGRVSAAYFTRAFNKEGRGSRGLDKGATGVRHMH